MRSCPRGNGEEKKSSFFKLKESAASAPGSARRECGRPRAGTLVVEERQENTPGEVV